MPCVQGACVRDSSCVLRMRAGLARSLSATKTHQCVTPGHAWVSMHNATCSHACVCMSAHSCLCRVQRCAYDTCPRIARANISRPPRFPCGAPMDCCDLPPRLAFGHLDSDGCLEDGLLFDILLAVIPGDTLAEREPLQHTKKQITLVCSVPETDKVLLLNRRHLGARRRLE